MRTLALWGHTRDEYREMFDLTPGDFNTRLLEYGCGPSAINAELHSDTRSVVSCDPLFALDKSTLVSKTALVFEDAIERMKKEHDKFDFTRYGSLEALVNKRQQGMQEFFADYERGHSEKRYLPVVDYTLPFADFSFDLALSSHYLFADLEEQGVDFHLQVLQELARVAKEVRIFPLIDREGQPSPVLGPVLLGLQAGNYGVEVREVPYHLQVKGNAMLRVWAQQCPLN
jgi:SAM-dependent methyltransferase